MAYKDKADQNAAARRWYEANKEKHLALVAQGKENYKEWYNGLKSEPCTDCGIKYDPVCMEFDHLPGFKKEFNIGVGFRRGYGKRRMLDEIAKCELVCRNCHALRTKSRW